MKDFANSKWMCLPWGPTGPPGRHQLESDSVSGRSIYRSESGRAAIREWCLKRLSRFPSRAEIETSLGRTDVTILGDGHDVVVLPGTNFATATWVDLLMLIGQRHRVIGADLPGQPGLSAPERPNDRDAYGPWLREILHTLELERPVVLGHSLAGRVALLAAAGDASIGGLVLVDPAGLIQLHTGGPAMLVTTMGWLVLRDDASSKALLRRMSAPGSTICHELVPWLTLVARHVRSSFAPPKLPPAALAAVRCPVSLVTGRGDPFLPADRLARAIRGIAGPVTVNIVEGTGHLLADEAPRDTLHAVEEVVAAVESA
jgi:pimeloyl-ACP methyl ester carboxylesterase